MVNGNHLARVDVTDELGADGIERAGLAGHHISVAQLGDGERMETVLVAACIDTVGSHNHQRERTLNHIERIDDVGNAVLLGGILLDKVGKQLAVRCGLQQASAALQIETQLLGVDNVTVVSQSKVARIVMECKGLDILHTAHVGGRITHMSDGDIAGKLIQMLLAEYLNHQTGTLMKMHALLVGSNDSATLLTAMLQAVQRIIGILCGVLHTVDAKHSAFVMQFFHILYSTVTDLARLRG